MALKDPEPAELDAMQAQFGLHELAVEDARHGHQRPKIEEYGDSLFVVLHTLEAEGDERVSGEVDAFVDRYFPIPQSTEDRLEACEEQILAESTGRASVEAL